MWNLFRYCLEQKKIHILCYRRKINKKKKKKKSSTEKNTQKKQAEAASHKHNS